jgi:AbrB family looped-hinge helix DNA binding protein
LLSYQFLLKDQSTETAKLTSKGQIVIPKRIRDAVRTKPGTLFSVRIEGSRIILDAPRSKDRKVSDSVGVNPRGIKLTARALCEPVTLDRDDDRG